MAHGKSSILTGRKIRLDKLDLKARFANRDDYESALAHEQTAMLHVQEAYYHEGRRAIIVFEGWDAAGKGGTIRRLTERLDPRGCKVWPIGVPKPEEQGRHYLYRFWQRLPEPGTIAVFDRSWYGRVLVERVEGFAKKPEWKRAYREINEFEQMLTEDGVRIVKLFLHITPDEQLVRFAERLRNPYKHWKITAEDLRNRERWDDYVKATHDMFDETSSEEAPWHALAANYKWQVRVHALKAVVKILSKDVSLTPPPVDPAVQKEAARALGISFRALTSGKIEAKEKGKGRKKQKADA